MPLRKDIVRGVRAGSILLAVLLLGYAWYRVAHEPTAAVVAPAAPAPETQPAPAIAPASSPSTSGPAIPPPPPPKGKRAVRVESVPMIPQTAATAAPPQAEEGPSKTEERDDAAEPAPAPAETSSDVKQDAAAVAEDPAAPEGRGKKMLKAVGRFLHIGGKKDAPQQAIRP